MEAYSLSLLTYSLTDSLSDSVTNLRTDPHLNLALGSRAFLLFVLTSIVQGPKPQRLLFSNSVSPLKRGDTGTL